MNDIFKISLPINAEVVVEKFFLTLYLNEHKYKKKDFATNVVICHPGQQAEKASLPVGGVVASRPEAQELLEPQVVVLLLRPRVPAETGF